MKYIKTYEEAEMTPPPVIIIPEDELLTFFQDIADEGCKVNTSLRPDGFQIIEIFQDGDPNGYYMEIEEDDIWQEEEELEEDEEAEEAEEIWTEENEMVQQDPSYRHIPDNEKSGYLDERFIEKNPLDWSPTTSIKVISGLIFDSSVSSNFFAIGVSSLILRSIFLISGVKKRKDSFKIPSNIWSSKKLSYRNNSIFYILIYIPNEIFKILRG